MGGAILMCMLFLGLAAFTVAMLRAVLIRVLPVGVKIFAFVFIAALPGTFTVLAARGLYNSIWGEEPSYTIENLADTLINRYDSNRDGTLQLPEEEEVDVQESDWHTYSHSPLFRASDHNHDSLVTRQELMQEIARSDANQDGKLSPPASLVRQWQGAGQTDELRVFHSTWPQYRSNGRISR